MSKEKIDTLGVLQRWRRLEVDYAALEHAAAAARADEQRKAAQSIESELTDCAALAKTQMCAPQGISAQTLRMMTQYMNVQSIALDEQKTKVSRLEAQAAGAHRVLLSRLERQLAVKKLSARTAAQAAVLQGRRDQDELDERGLMSSGRERQQDRAK